MLRTAAVAPELRFPGVAAFAVLAGPPTRVRVFGPSGTVIEDVTLALPVAARCDPRSSGGLLHVGGPG